MLLLCSIYRHCGSWLLVSVVCQLPKETDAFACTTLLFILFSVSLFPFLLYRHWQTAKLYKKIKILLLYFLIVSIVLANRNEFQWRLWLLFDPDNNCAVIYSSIKNLLLTHHPTKQNQSSYPLLLCRLVSRYYPFVQLLVCAPSNDWWLVLLLCSVVPPLNNFYTREYISYIYKSKRYIRSSSYPPHHKRAGFVVCLFVLMCASV